MTISFTALSIRLPISVNMLRIPTHSVRTLSITALSLKTLRIMTHVITTVSIMTISIIAQKGEHSV